MHPEETQAQQAKAFRDLRSLVNWPFVTEFYVSPLIGTGAPSRWQVELMLSGGKTVAFASESLPEAIAEAKKWREANPINSPDDAVTALNRVLRTEGRGTNDL